MKTTYPLIRMLISVMTLAVSSVVHADASCKDWSAATVDPTKGRYPIELRICDLTYGLSAYVEIKNLSSSRIALAYRIITNDDKQRDTEIVLAPSVTTRAENCQACATRHAGFKSWEILSATEAAPADQSGVSEAVAAPLPAFMGQPGSAKVPAPVPEKRSEIAQPSSTKPIVEKPMAEKPIAAKPVATPAIAAEPPKAVAPPKAVVAEPATAPAAVAAPEADPKGFRAEDGTIIPWEQLPPEFRPRK